MIVSHSHRFLFLKPFKVGGTSVLQALGTTCHDGDLVSAVFLEPEELHRFPTSQLTPLPQHVCVERPRATRYKINTWLNSHALPRMIIEAIGRALWDASFRFTIVRNPWDLMVSFRRMQLLNPNGYRELATADFSSFVRQFDFAAVPPPYHEAPINDCWYFDPASGEPLVNYFLRFEHLQTDFDKLCDRLEIPRQSLPHLQNKGGRPHYRCYYDQATRERVGKLFARTIEHFGYTFE
jgi:hypothetical protein